MRPAAKAATERTELMVELMRKKANSTDRSDHAAIKLDTCIVRVSKNWFVIVGTVEKTSR